MFTLFNNANSLLLSLHTQVGWKHLQDDVALLGESNPNTALVWNLADGEDPDNAYSSVPYEKVRQKWKSVSGVV